MEFVGGDRATAWKYRRADGRIPLFKASSTYKNLSLHADLGFFVCKNSASYNIFDESLTKFNYWVLREAVF